MESNENSNSSNKPVAIKADEALSNTFSNFEEKDDFFVPESAEEKVAKEREYYDAKENPARKYNINDQAFSQSSPENFIKTTSGFTHSDGTKGGK